MKLCIIISEHHESEKESTVFKDGLLCAMQSPVYVITKLPQSRAISCFWPPFQLLLVPLFEVVHP